MKARLFNEILSFQYVLLPCSLIVVAACNKDTVAKSDQGNDSGSDTGADTDNDADTDGDADSDADSDACPKAVVKDCADKGWPKPYDKVADSADFGEDVFFVDVSGNKPAILAERRSGDSIEPIVFAVDWAGVLTSNKKLKHVEIGSASASGMRAIAIVAGNLSYSETNGAASGDSIFGYGAVALLCATGDGRECALYGATAENGEFADLTRIPSSDVPLKRSTDMTGKETGSDLCVTGSAIACFDGTKWETAYSPKKGAIIDVAANYVASGKKYVMAAGQDGLAIFETPSGWKPLSTNVSFDLKAIGGDESFVVLAGSGGLVVRRTSGKPFCGLSDESYFALTGSDHVVASGESFGTVTSITAKGSVEEWSWALAAGTLEKCVFDKSLEGSPKTIIDWVPATDGAATMVVTDTAIYAREEGGGITE